MSGRLARAETLSTALGALGVSGAQVHAVVVALDGIYDFRAARAGSKFEVHLDDESSLGYLRFDHGPTDIFEVTRGEEGDYEGRRVDVPLTTEEALVGVVIETSLYRALDEAGEGPDLVSILADVFAWDIDFQRDQQPGDSFRLVVEKTYAEGRFVGYGRVLAAEYFGKVGTLRTFWYAPNGDETKAEYFLEDGRSARKFFLATPLKYTRVSSRFSRARKHPILGYTRAHLGVDYAAPRGTPVRAMAGGTVTFAGRKGANGKMVKIRHRAGLVSSYSHLHRIGKGIRRGAKVKQKQVIGQVGSTGLSTGPHLHFAVRKNGKMMNPQKLELSRMDPVARTDRTQFEQLVAAQIDRLRSIDVPSSPDSLRASR